MTTERKTKYLDDLLTSVINSLIAIATNLSCATAIWLLFDASQLIDLFHGANLSWLQWVGVTFICDMLFTKSWTMRDITVSAAITISPSDDN